MGIKCGSCKEYHDTAREVRECYAKRDFSQQIEDNLPVHPVIPREEQPLATEKQVAFIKTLIAERFDPASNPVPHPETLTRKDASAVIEGLLKKPKLPGAQVNMPGGTIVAGKIAKPGTFTVVLGDGERRTIRVHLAKQGRLAGKQVFKFLSGPNNEDDYTAFGEETDDGVKVWSRFKGNSQLVEALKVLMGMGDKEKAAAGLQYALESNNCYVCGRTLTVPASVNAGIGPICAGKGMGY